MIIFRIITGPARYLFGLFGLVVASILITIIATIIFVWLGNNIQILDFLQAPASLAIADIIVFLLAFNSPKD